jgi:hypothetical protein
MCERFLITTLLFVLIAVEDLSGQVRFGVRAGLSIANERHKILKHPVLDFGKSYFHRNAVAPVGGFYSEYFFKPQASLEVSLLYLGMGYRSKPPANYTQKDHIDYRYVSLPVVLKYHADERLSLLVGAYTNYLFYAMMNDTRDILDDRKRLDFGIQCGFEMDVYRNIGLGGRYSLGIVNADQPDREWYKRYHRGIQFYTYYYFSISGGKQKSK